MSSGAARASWCHLHASMNRHEVAGGGVWGENINVRSPDERGDIRVLVSRLRMSCGRCHLAPLAGEVDREASG